jgi:hypothetical protein
MVVAGALLALAPALARAGTATAVVMLRGAGDAIGASQRHVFGRAGSSAPGSGTSGQLEPRPSCVPSRSSVDLDFAPPPMPALTPAAHDAARPVRAAGKPGIEIFDDGRRCDGIAGRLEVMELAVSDSRRLQRLSIVHQQHGDGAAPALPGTFGYRPRGITPPPAWKVSAPGTTGPNGGGPGARRPAAGLHATGGSGGAAAGSPAPRVAGSTREPPGEEPCPDRRYDPIFVLRGSRGADRIRGGRHGELVLAGAGADRVVARGGDDCVDGGPGRDRLSGGTGDDVLSGGTGNDALSGGSGDDLLSGDSGADALSGGAGDDLLIAGRGRDRLDCGSGRRDVARVEPGDRVRRCERIVRAG